MSALNNNIIVRPAEQRGHGQHGWLNSYHTFSFADYYDPQHMGFHTLRVINEDRIQAASGFGAHSHQNMEIVSYVVSGGLEHEDSMGNKSIIIPGDVQVMSAGRGVVHAEMNHFKDQETHFLQIWILPQKKDIAPNYGQKSFKDQFARQKLTLVVSQDKREGSIGINQDANIYVGRMKAKDEMNINIPGGRYFWLQVIKGGMEINKVKAKAGDGVAASGEEALTVSAREPSEFILFDLK